MGWSANHPKGLIHYSPHHTYRGYTLVTTAGGNRTVLIDMEGRICHRWDVSEGIGYSYLLDNGNLLLRTGGPKGLPSDAHPLQARSAAAVQELDWDGNVVWEHRSPDMFPHHDMERLPSGNTLILMWAPIPDELAAKVQGGFTTDTDPDQMYGDVVREITLQGEVSMEWRSWEHLDPESDVICHLEGRQEWTHQNALSVTSDEDLLVSFRQTSTVGIVNRATGEFTWKWGNGDISHQHNPTFLANGRVLIFDNGPHRPGFSHSRVIEVDPDTNDIAWEYQGDPPISFYSYHISGAQRLPNGNTLICEGAPGRFFEVTLNKEIVWEYVNPFMAPIGRGGGGGASGMGNSAFRVHRYGPDHPALKDKDLDPAQYANLNRLYAEG